MKTLKQHIQESFKLGDDNFKSRNDRKETCYNEVLEKILNILYIKDSIDDCWQEGYTDKDYEDIKKKIYEEYIEKYKLMDQDKLMFISRRGRCPEEYSKYYKKDNRLWEHYGFGYTDKSTIIWKKKSFYFTIHTINKEIILCKHGPLGGLKICVYKE